MRTKMENRKPRVVIEVTRFKIGKGGDVKVTGVERYLTWSAEIAKSGIHCFGPNEGFDTKNHRPIEVREFVHTIKLGKHDSARQFSINKFGLVND